MAHGNYLGPLCRWCGDKIYLTASDGHWTHQAVERKECPDGKSVAKPRTTT